MVTTRSMAASKAVHPAAASSQSNMLHTFKYMVLTQVVSRVVPFLVNALVARRLSPGEMGVSTIHFALVLSVALSAREGFRRASLRGADTAGSGGEGRPGAPSGSTTDCQAVVIAGLALPLGVVLGGVTWLLAASYGGGVGHGHTGDETYMGGMRLHLLGAFLELGMEPLYVLAQRRTAMRLRVVAETLATLTRCCTLYFLFQVRGVPSALAFGYAQICYAAALGLAYASTIGRGVPALLHASPWWNPALLQLSVSFTVQALWKLVLAEGEKAALMVVAATDDQGVYGLVANLGSLFVRVVLAPFEESAFHAFSRAQAIGPVSEDVTHAAPAVRRQATKLALLVKLAVLGGAAVAVYGSSYAYLLIRTLYGPKWSDATDAPAVFSWYCLYVLVLAVNGITEAFVHAVSNAKQLRAQNKWLLLFSLGNLLGVVVLQRRLGTGALRIVGASRMWKRRRMRAGSTLMVTTYVALPLGNEESALTGGIILANTATMGARIAYTAWLIRVHFGQVALAERGLWLPPPGVLAALAASAAATGATAQLFRAHVGSHAAAAYAGHLTTGVASVAAVTLSMWRLDRPFCKQLVSLRRGVEEKEA